MTKEEITKLAQNPENLTPDQVAELKELAGFYPYFTLPHVLLAKYVTDSQDVQAQKYINKAAVYVNDKRWFFYYIFPEKKLTNEMHKFERVPKYNGNYFDLVNAVESKGEDGGQSLKDLAARLKSAIITVSHDEPKPVVKKQEPQKEPVRLSTPDYFNEKSFMETSPEVTEENAKKLIKEKKYAEAIVILKKLNLINPKKSIYFADQIRFLEKILVISKK